MSRVALGLLVLLAGCPAQPEGGGVAQVASSSAAVVRPRVITSAPALAEIVCAVGGLPNLVGVSRYCLEPPEVRALPQIGGAIDPNLEAIDRLAPDLVLVQARDERLEELAQARGFALESFRIETIAEAQAAITRVGELLGRQEAARAEVARLTAALDRLRAEPLPGGRRVPALVVFDHRPGELTQVSAPGSGTFIAEALALAGGESCLQDLPPGAWHVLSLEAVMARKPELIIELSTEPVDAAQAARLRADWEGVSSGRIAIVEGNDVLLPGPRLDRVAAKLARAVRGEDHVR
jgi:iron complex transport system substrate-binding protein